ncbi:hypothetical protein RSAG8_07928, partial [Rhizoctonia solani AG-8 WAC10335]
MGDPLEDGAHATDTRTRVGRDLVIRTIPTMQSVESKDDPRWNYGIPKTVTKGPPKGAIGQFRFGGNFPD